MQRKFLKFSRIYENSVNFPKNFPARTQYTALDSRVKSCEHERIKKLKFIEHNLPGTFVQIHTRIKFVACMNPLLSNLSN